MGNIKQINIKNRTYYFLNHMINIKNLDSRLLKIEKKSYKNIGIYNIGYITIKIVLVIMKTLIVDGYIEENNGNKYLTFPSTDKNKKILEK